MKNGKRILNVRIVKMDHQDPDTSYLDQDGWEERKAEYRSGDFSFVGVRAEAEVQLETNGAIQRLTSGGLWGVETDSDRTYFASIGREELADLKSTMESAGFSKRAIATACKGVTL
jgi:hypothetical protein